MAEEFELGNSLRDFLDEPDVQQRLMDLLDQLQNEKSFEDSVAWLCREWQFLGEGAMAGYFIAFAQHVQGLLIKQLAWGSNVFLLMCFAAKHKLPRLREKCLQI